MLCGCPSLLARWGCRARTALVRRYLPPSRAALAGCAALTGEALTVRCAAAPRQPGGSRVHAC
eukprot:11496594-Alexandrium_andersonii.AAC.1